VLHSPKRVLSMPKHQGIHVIHTYMPLNVNTYHLIHALKSLILVCTHDKVANILFPEGSMYRRESCSSSQLLRLVIFGCCKCSTYSRDNCSPRQHLWPLTLDSYKRKILLKCRLSCGFWHVMDKVISTELPYYWM